MDITKKIIISNHLNLLINQPCVSDVNTKTSFDFDIVKDVLEPSIKYGIFPRHQNNPSFTPEYKHDNKSYNNYQSRHIVPLGGSNPYRVTHLPDDPDEMPQYPLTISEAYDEANYKQFVIAKGLAPTEIKFLQFSQTICLPPDLGFALQ